MYLGYLREVLKRAFRPTARITDAAQILTASALPGASKFLGLKMPETITNDVLAYIGAAALSYVVIRLFWAPYAIWRDDRAEIGALKLELTRPERMELERLANLRARARTRLAAEASNCIRAIRLCKKAAVERSAERMSRIANVAGLGPGVHGAIGVLGSILDAAMLTEDATLVLAVRVERALVEHLQHRLSDVELDRELYPIIVSLKLQSPPGTEPETPL